MSTPDDDRFERDAKRWLREGADELDAATLSRLNRARQTALDEYDRQRRRPAWLAASGWPAAIAVASVAALAVALGVGRAPAPTGDETRAEQSADIDVMLGDVNLELIEDLEFYDWLGNDLQTEADIISDLTG